MKTVKWIITFAVFLLLAAAVFRYFVVPEYILPKKYSEIVEKYSDEYNIDEYLVYSVIHAESGFKKEAVSHKAAKGLMQITESTGQWAAEKIGIEDFETNDLLEPETNIKIGCWYLSELLEQFDGEKTTALAAYNAGSGKVNGWLSEAEYSLDGKTLNKIPYEETLNYVRKIELIYKLYKFVYLR